MKPHLPGPRGARLVLIGVIRRIRAARRPGLWRYGIGSAARCLQPAGNGSRIAARFPRSFGRRPPLLDAEVRLAVYRHFLEEGHAPTLEALASGLGHPLAEIEASVLRLAEARLLVLEPDSTAIRMAMPFSNVRTAFRVEVPFLSWYANCAWDALGIPALLHGSGRLPGQSPQRIITACADCDETLTLLFPEAGAPPSLASDFTHESPGPPPVVHFALPAARWWDDILHT